MDHNPFASRLGATSGRGRGRGRPPSNNPTDVASISNLIASAEREAARRNALQSAARNLGVARPPPSIAGARNTIQDQLVLDALMARAPQPQQLDLQSMIALNRQLEQQQQQQQRPPPRGPVQPRPLGPSSHGQQQPPPRGPIQPRPPLRIPFESEQLAPPSDRMKLQDIDEPHPHDVLCGRGQEYVDGHVGNKQFQQLVEAQKIRYYNTGTREKSRIAKDIVRAVRAQDPPGRFLERGLVDCKFHDIGDDKARLKTAEALREGRSDFLQQVKDYGFLQSLPLHATQLHETFNRTADFVPTTYADAASSLLASHNPALVAAAASARRPSSGEATSHAFMPFSQLPRDDNTTEALAKALNMNPSSKHLLNNLSSNGKAAAEKLAAEIMDTHVKQQANAAQLAAASRVAAMSRGIENPNAHRVAPSNGMAALGRGIPPNFPPNLHSLDTGLVGGLLPPIGRGGVLPEAGPPLGMQQQEEEEQQQQLVPEQVLVGTRQLLAHRHLEEQRNLDSNGLDRGMLSTLSRDLIERLVLAETLAQRTVRCTVTETLKAKEKRMGLYLDAGLLGINLGEMAENRIRGQSEESVVEEYYNKMKRKESIMEEYCDKMKRKRGDESDDGERKRSATEEPANKTQKLNETSTANNGRARDVNAVGAVGATFQLRAQESEGDGETETESESEDSD